MRNDTKVKRRLVRGPDAAKYIGMSDIYLRKSRCDGTRYGHTPAPPFVRIGRAIRYDIADLDAFIEAHKHEPASPPEEWEES
jgi:predicted DNA-binding transcriptional regulator AlpA